MRHSRSPAMHRAAYAALGLSDHHYQLLPVPPDVFEQTARALGASGFRGANVTIPHKEAALRIAGEATERANRIGAANTLTYRPDGVVHADNTDAPGLLSAIGQDLDGAHAVVLGAGGSARAAVYALRGAGAARVDVVNRTRERAERLAEDLGATAVAVVPERADILVNTTSIGLDGRSSVFKELPLDADAVASFNIVVDLVYSDGDTELLAAARRHGRKVVDGLEILVAQGALSFEAWTGLEAPTAAMLQAARHPDNAPGHPPPPSAPER